MTVGLVLACIFWLAVYSYPWIDWFMGHTGIVERLVWNWLERYATENDMLSWFAPFDFNDIKKNFTL